MTRSNGLKSFTIDKGVNLHCMETDKFKTFRLGIYIQRPLNKDEVTKNALLVSVLRRGCMKLDTEQKISQYLQEMYGAGFGCGVRKKGDTQVLSFAFDFVNDLFIQENLMERMLQLSKDIVFDPLVVGDGFSPEYVELEKFNLRTAIQGLINDKKAYAAEQCFRAMCKGEAFEIYEMGCVEDISPITPTALYEHYKKIINSSPIDIFITGNFDKISPEQLYASVSKLFKLEGHRGERPQSVVSPHSGTGVKNITERLDVMQSKLHLGFKTNIAPNDSRYYALIVYSGILGGGTHSKLFSNVREKLSLAYYAFSKLERFKGIMMVGCGIDGANYKAATDEILLQIEQMKKGNISDHEHRDTISSFVNMVRSTTDSASAVEDYYFSQILTNTKDDFDSLIEKVSKVSIQEVIDVAQGIQLDTIYFLTGKDEEARHGF